jgi:hypothetical protein
MTDVANVGLPGVGLARIRRRSRVAVGVAKVVLLTPGGAMISG